MATILYKSAYLKAKMLGNITGTAYTFPATQYVAFFVANFTSTAANPGYWAASIAATAGQYVSPTTANGHLYVCTTAGTTGTTQPTWPTGIGSTVVDGGGYLDRSHRISDWLQHHLSSCRSERGRLCPASHRLDGMVGAVELFRSSRSPDFQLRRTYLSLSLGKLGTRLCRRNFRCVHSGRPALRYFSPDELPDDHLREPGSHRSGRRPCDRRYLIREWRKRASSVREIL